MSIQLSLIEIEMETAVSGLVFRHYRGEEDIPAMVDIINKSNLTDGVEWVATVEESVNNYRHLTNCDPTQDVVIAEVHGEMVGYGRCWWHQQLDGDRLYSHFAHVLPAWRDEGIRRTIVQFNETRLRTISATHPKDGKRWLNCWASETETHWENLLLGEGYKPIRYFNPDLWQVAWDGDEVAGGVLNFINELENEEYGRLRGYTEDIFVRRPWRKQGLAKALIARSLQVLKNEGIEEAALGVDAENPTGAVQLYTGMGFQTVKQSATYRKRLRSRLQS